MRSSICIWWWCTKSRRWCPSLSLPSPASDEHRTLHGEKRLERAGIWWGNAVHGQVKIAANGRLPCPWVPVVQIHVDGVFLATLQVVRVLCVRQVFVLFLYWRQLVWMGVSWLQHWLVSSSALGRGIRCDTVDCNEYFPQKKSRHIWTTAGVSVR